MQKLENSIEALSNVAREFCLIIENVELYKNKTWLSDIARILSELQTVMESLDDSEIEYSYFALPDLEARFEMYCSLKDQLGDFDAYFLEYDWAGSEEEMTGSLASDIVDIYFELKRGLDLFDTGIEYWDSARTMWQTGYLLIWGRHLANAQKHLSSLNLVAIAE